MARLLLILVLAAVIFWVLSVVDCAVQPAVRHRGVSKPTWLILVIVLPVVGGLLWFTIGRLSTRALAVRAPDDDPEFLRTLGTVGPAASQQRRAEQERRIRQLEQELARLDDDDDSGTGSGPRAHGPRAH